MVVSLRCLDSRALVGRPCTQRSNRTPAIATWSRRCINARPGHLRAVGGGDQDVQQTSGVAQSPVVLQATEEITYATPEATATYTANLDPQFRAYQQAQQQYYGAAPPSYPNYPMYLPPPAPASTGLPWWILVGGGVLLGAALSKISELVKKGPQQMMAEMAMKQMMGSMGGGAGQMPPGFPGAPPFGGPAGASPFGAGASPFGGFPTPPQPPSGGYNSQASSATVDATASSVQQQQQQSGRGGEAGRPGEKFQSRLGGSSNGTGSADSLPVVEPTVSEPTASSGRNNGASASTSSSPPRNAFFTDVNVDEPSKASSGAAGGWAANGAAAQQPGAAGTSAADPEGVDAMGTMLEQMLRSPNMQKMLYPYLPENMRNPTSIEWMLGNPEVKKQMATMFAQQNISPQMLNMMKNMDFNQDKVDKQFQELGMKPEDVMSKVMANPELAAGFSNPRVQQAIMDISSNPMNITKYAGDPEIMKVLNEVQQIFQPDVPPQYRQ